jgi:hypothetical protein
VQDPYLCIATLVAGKGPYKECQYELAFVSRTLKNKVLLAQPRLYTEQENCVANGARVRFWYKQCLLLGGTAKQNTSESPSELKSERTFKPNTRATAQSTTSWIAMVGLSFTRAKMLWTLPPHIRLLRSVNRVAVLPRSCWWNLLACRRMSRFVSRR